MIRDLSGIKQLGLVLTLGFFLLYVPTHIAITVDFFSWELRFTKWLQQVELGELRFVKGWIFWMGIRGVAGSVMLACFVTFWLLKYRIEAVFILAIGVPLVLNTFLKELIGRPRPTSDLVDVLVMYGGAQGSGFPSGHAIHVVLFYGFLVFLFIRHTKKRILICPISILFVIYVIVTGLWLVYDGRHWIMDVIGGYIYGGCYLMSFIWGYRLLVSRFRNLPSRPMSEL